MVQSFWFMELAKLLGSSGATVYFLPSVSRRNVMTEKQWNQLVSVINGEVVKPVPVGFIIDSPWLVSYFLGITYK